MFARVVETTVKTERKQEVHNLVQNELLPLIKRQPGFVDALAITHENNPQEMLAVTLWKTPEEADKFHRNNRDYQQIMERLRPMLNAEPRIRTGTVEFSSTHHIASGKAA